MSGVRLEINTHIISGASTSLNNLEKTFSQVGVDMDGVAFSGYASSLAVLSDTEKELGVVLIDIGAGTTDIAIYVEGSLAHSSVIPVGARHITNDLAIGLRISLESAEKIKLFLSQARKKSIRDDRNHVNKEVRTTDEIDLSPLGLSEDIRKASQKTLIEGIIRPRLNEIFTMVGLEVKRSGFGGQIPAGVVITGGGALTVAAENCAKRALAMPVRIGFPTNIKGIIEEIQGPAFATVIGLAMYGTMLKTKAFLPFGITFKIPNIRFSKIFSRIVSIARSFMP